jgi:hypothetical protein
MDLSTFPCLFSVPFRAPFESPLNLGPFDLGNEWGQSGPPPSGPRKSIVEPKTAGSGTRTFENPQLFCTLTY